jgi:hypothetical protein
MYVNVKMIPVETVSGIGGVGIGKAVEGENSQQLKKSLIIFIINVKKNQSLILCKTYEK